MKLSLIHPLLHFLLPIFLFPGFNSLRAAKLSQDLLTHGYINQRILTPAKNLFTYQGHEDHRDFGINLTMAGARCYNPTIGRMLSYDPMSGAAPDWSGYVWTRNNPINRTDPTGMYTDGYGTWKDAPTTARTFKNVDYTAGSKTDNKGTDESSDATTDTYSSGSSGDKLASRSGQVETREPNVVCTNPGTVVVSAHRQVRYGVMQSFFFNRFSHWRPTGLGTGLSVNPLFPQHSDVA